MIIKKNQLIIFKFGSYDDIETRFLYQSAKDLIKPNLVIRFAREFPQYVKRDAKLRVINKDKFIKWLLKNDLIKEIQYDLWRLED